MPIFAGANQKTMKNQFNLAAIIKHYNLVPEHVAKALFPKAKFPMRALARIINNVAFLDTNQLQTLANLAGVIVQDLFTINNWRGSSDKGNLIFKKDDITVKVTYNGVYMTIYKNDKPVISKLLFNKDLKVEDFLQSIENFIV